MAEPINESEMDFIADNYFHIEQSPFYSSLLNNGIKSVEFIRSKGNKLLFIEVKRILLNFYNYGEDNKFIFELRTKEICDKFVHSLNIFSSIKTGVAGADFPADFVTPDKISLCQDFSDLFSVSQVVG